MKNALSLVGCLFLLASCQFEKGTALQSTSGVKSAVTAGDILVPTGIILDFISIGSGIDNVAFDTAQSIISNHVSLGEVEEVKQENWGREGERKVCVNLKSYDFLKGLRSELEDAGVMFAKSNLVQFKFVNDCSELTSNK
jgi:hypothetical protein